MLPPLRITVRNYRCFSDTHPLVVDLKPGFIALIGPNNSGKSSFLRMFFELRGLLGSLTNPNVITDSSNGHSFRVNYEHGVTDPDEIFFNGNSADLSVEFELFAEDLDDLKKVVAVVSRRNPYDWKASYFIGPNFESVAVGQNSMSDQAKVMQFRTSRGLNRVSMETFIDWLNALANSLYVGAFRNAIGQGNGNYYDLPIGSQFITQWNQWKTGTSVGQNTAAQNITRELERIFGYNRLEINSTQDNKDIQVVTDGRPYRLRELGAGFAQFLIVFAYVAMRKPPFLLIDEPEINLHPTLQMDFLSSLTAYTQYGTVFATHSMGLAKSVAESIYSFQKPTSHSLVRPYAKTENLAEFLGQMSFEGYRELGCDWILLVEGVNDVLCVQEFLSILGKAHKIAVLSFGGGEFIAGKREHELAELKRLTGKIAVLIDSEKSSAEAVIESKRLTFEQTCISLGYTVLLTKRRAIENYFTDEALKLSLGSDYAALGHFQSLNEAVKKWHKHDNWRIAKQMKREDLVATDIGEFLLSLD